MSTGNGRFHDDAISHADPILLGRLDDRADHLVSKNAGWRHTMTHVTKIDVEIRPTQTRSCHFDRHFVLEPWRTLDLTDFHLLHTRIQTGLQGTPFLTLDL